MAIWRRKKAPVTWGRTVIAEADIKRGPVRFFYWGLLTFLILGTLTTFLPLFWGGVGALKSPAEFFAFPPTILPKPALQPLQWQWANYLEAVVQVKYLKYFFNTIILAIGVWFFQIFPTAMAAYAISKLRLGWLSFVPVLFFATLLVPFFTILIPLFLTVRDVPIVHVNLMDPKLLGGYFAIMLPAGVNAFNIFVFKSFFDEIPLDLFEAARIDGASELRIFFSIVIPLSQPIFAVLSIFSFMFTWNDWFWPYLVLHNDDWWTIMLRIFYLDLQGDVPYNVFLAALMLTAIPPIIVFLIFQKRIMQGITLTGLKV